MLLFLKYNKWALLWALLILALCGIPGKDIPHISFLEILSFDKFVHAALFFVLILLAIRGFLLQENSIKLKHSAKWLALLLCIVYGGLLEIMQAKLFEGRNADLFDFLANSLGSTIGFVFYNKLEKIFFIRFIN